MGILVSPFFVCKYSTFVIPQPLAHAAKQVMQDEPTKERVV